jgi:hypothetical protein
VGDSTEVTVDATLLLALTERAAMFAGADRIHQDVWSIGANAGAWARGAGLIVGEPDTPPLERARFERLAARVFPAAPADPVTLYTTTGRSAARPRRWTIFMAIC